ncbi:MAG: FeoA family protein [Verrucomicrobiota bacterium]
MNSSREPFRPQRMQLTAIANGASGRVCALEGLAEVCERLREMGIGEGVVVKRMSGQGTLLCLVGHTRIALSEQAAGHIVVELLPSAH